MDRCSVPTTLARDRAPVVVIGVRRRSGVDAEMKPPRHSRSVANFNRGWRGPRDRREGARQRAVRRAFAYADVLTTAELMQYVWPRLKIVGRLPRWRWYLVRRAAERYADRALDPRRSRPLKWRLNSVSGHSIRLRMSNSMAWLQSPVITHEATNKSGRAPTPTCQNSAGPHATRIG